MMTKLKDRIRTWWMSWVDRVEREKAQRRHLATQMQAEAFADVWLTHARGKRGLQAKPVRALGGPEGIYLVEETA